MASHSDVEEIVPFHFECCGCTEYHTCNILPSLTEVRSGPFLTTVPLRSPIVEVFFQLMRGEGPKPC
jgi:hypothetical protein